MRFLENQKSISTTKFAIVASLFFVVFYNVTFFRHVIAVYPISWKNIPFLMSLAIGLAVVIFVLLSLISSKYTTKASLIVLFLTSSVSAYFMDHFDIPIDKGVIRSIFDTSAAEIADLISIKLLYNLIFLGALPSIAVYNITLAQYSIVKTALYKIRNIVIALVLLFAIILTFSKFYTSFFREQKPLRYYTNPTYFLYSTGKYLSEVFDRSSTTIAPIGLDARVIRPDQGNYRKLIILVVGEAARADHFSLNGYPRETNPLLKKEQIINFSQMYSCGTSTAYSIPCMFSPFPRSEYSEKKGSASENVLDVLRHTGSIDILWRDNNSDSKGTALRVAYEEYKTSEKNPVCTDGECRDVGMLIGLSDYVEQRKYKNILIILHQMGNHGPAYYKRYPKEFEKFKPICATNQLEECSNADIANSYDNALLYTDYFLSRVINFLKNEEKTRETAMLYLSDHGESLGENGLYLHGLPYSIAPKSQIHIGAVMWFGDNISKHLNLNKVRLKKDERFSHDNLFHTLLGIFNVHTKEYKEDMDILHD